MGFFQGRIKPLARIWHLGADARSGFGRRETILANQVAVLAALATSMYEVFYLVYDFGLFWPVFTANLVFISLYLSVPAFNRAGWFTLASGIVFVGVLVQLAVVTYFISTGAGVHLFYFTLASLPALLYSRIRLSTTVLIAVLAGGLYTMCHFLFTPARAAIPVPPEVLSMLYAGSVQGAVLLSALFSYLFRQEIRRAEDDLVKVNSELEELSTRDGLTGLANRRSLDAFLAREADRMAREGGPLSLLMVDVDHFKRFNDRFGHQAGDQCLQVVAELIQAAARRPTDLAARYGGEEFVLVLSNTPLEGAIERAEALRRAVAAAEVSDMAPVDGRHVTASVGIATAGSVSRTSPDELIAEADRCLYAAKEAGRNRCVAGGDSGAGREHVYGG